jgi:hypothetical protein
VTACRPQLGALFGTGRSGTTWLGAIVDSSPTVAYRFEPFSRLRNHPRIQHARTAAESSSLPTADARDIVYRALRPAHPRIVKDPFFAKSCSRSLGRRPAWYAARLLPALNPIVERVYTPAKTTPIVFKEVAYYALMHHMLRLEVPTVFLIRDPRAVVASLLVGQKQNLMPSGRLGVLDDLARKHDPELSREFDGTLQSRSSAFMNAMLWRLDVEEALRVHPHPQLRLIYYESLCTSPTQVATETFEHLGLELTDETLRFIAQSTGSDDSANREQTDPYFSVFRDPKKSMSKWRSTLTESNLHDIEAALASSTVYASLRTDAGWDARD